MGKIFNQKGSLLMEILIAIAVGAIIIGAVSGLVYVSSKSGQISGQKSSAISLAEEGMEAMHSISESDWHNIYLPPNGAGDPDVDKGFAKPYYVYKSGSSWVLGSVVVGDEGDINIGGIVYTRKIYIYNINRNSIGDREIIAVGGVPVPSTQKIKVVVSREGNTDVVLEEYLTRWKNNIFSQTNWSGGKNQDNFLDNINKYFADDGNIEISDPAGSIRLKQ